MIASASRFTSQLPALHHPLAWPAGAAGPGRQPDVAVPPGASRTYAFTLPPGCAGTCVPPAPRTATCEQVFRGLAGCLIVRPAIDPLAAPRTRHDGHRPAAGRQQPDRGQHDSGQYLHAAKATTCWSTAPESAGTLSVQPAPPSAGASSTPPITRVTCNWRSATTPCASPVSTVG